MDKGQIIIDPEIMMGKPVVAGTRITVELILEKLASGISMEQLCSQYPQLKREDILAALSYARDVLKSEDIYPLHPKAA